MRVSRWSESGLNTGFVSGCRIFNEVWKAARMLGLRAPRKPHKYCISGSCDIFNKVSEAACRAGLQGATDPVFMRVSGVSRGVACNGICVKKLTKCLRVQNSAGNARWPAANYNTLLKICQVFFQKNKGVNTPSFLLC